MGGLKASDVSEELVSGAWREAEWDFVYREMKPPAGVGIFAMLANRALLPIALCKLEAPVAWMDI